MTVGAVTILLVCQFAGEILVRLFGWPVPGPVMGMGVLFLLLLARGGNLPGMEDTAGGLLRNLSLAFIPAGVGIVTYLGLLTDQWLPVAAAVLPGTILSIGVTGWIWQRLARNRDEAAP